LFVKYPFWSPYAFASDMPSWAIDLDGEEYFIVTKVYEPSKIITTVKFKVVPKASDINFGTKKVWFGDYPFDPKKQVEVIAVTDGISKVEDTRDKLSDQELKDFNQYFKDNPGKLFIPTNSGNTQPSLVPGEYSITSTLNLPKPTITKPGASTKKEDGGTKPLVAILLDKITPLTILSPLSATEKASINSLVKSINAASAKFNVTISGVGETPALRKSQAQAVYDFLVINGLNPTAVKVMDTPAMDNFGKDKLASPTINYWKK
jgi:hypothetical protein